MIKSLLALVYTLSCFLFVVTSHAQCPPNIDFEQGNFNNWRTYTGSVRDSSGVNVVTLAPSGVVANRHTIITAASSPAVDPYGGFPVLCPNGSNYSVKLGNNQSGRQAEAISYTFTVPMQNDFSVVYNYAVVFEDPNHRPYEQPRFNAKVFDVAANQYISCASFEYISTANLPGFQSVTVNGTVVRYKSWTPVSINLRGYAGKVIRLEFTTADCTLGVHFGYAYLDVACASIVSGDNPFCKGKTSITLSGPFGFQGYQWSLNNFGTILDTTRTITLAPPPANNTPLSLVLIPYAGFGCRDTINTFIRENPLPTVNAGPDKTACKGTPVQIGTPALPNTSYTWSSISSADSTLAQPFVTPATPTTYYLTAISDTSHCSKKDTVLVTPHVVDTSMRVTGLANVCRAASVHVQLQLLSPAPTIQWYMNGVPVPGATSATYNADTFGLYYAVVKGAFCTDTTRKINLRGASTVVGFNVNQQGQCLRNNVFQFTNTSTSSDSLQYTWNFSDGGTATTVNATHTFPAPGIYEVMLIAVNSLGCADTLIKSVEVYPMPHAIFIVHMTQCMPDSIFRFSNGTNLSSGTATYQWSFGDGTTSTDVNPIHAYSTPGTYTVSLIATSNNGCSDTLVRTVTLYPKATAGFTVNNASQCFSNNSFTFTNTSTAVGTTTYAWSFGDSGTSTAINPTHVYTTPGADTVKLVVTSGNGCKDSLIRIVHTYPKPVAGFNVNTVQCLPDINFIFANTSSGAVSYQWTFGDGGASTAVNPSYAYAAAGTYTVRLIAIASGGCRDTMVKSVTLQPRPTAGFAVNTASQCLKNNSFTFTNTSTQGVVSTYLWHFGDGTTSTATSPSHVYTSPGTYTVNLMVTSGASCKDSISRTVNVYAAPIAGFTVAAAQCQPNNNFTFTNTSTLSSGSSTYQWSFGDGGSSAVTSPSHVYATTGSFNTKLVVVSNHGCKDSVVKTVKLYPKATAGFTVNNASQCFNQNIFTFTNTSVPAGTNPSYLWVFGDSITSTATSPVHIYTNAGTYNTMLIAFSSNGCKDTLSRTINVNPKPTVAFTANAASQCLAGNKFMFTNGSSISVGTMSYHWYFGDGSTTTGTNPTHVYAATGTYIVKVVATSNNGCKDSIAHTVTVKPSPAALFTINDSTQCLNGNNFHFTNTSVNPPGTTTYSWVFGDGGTSAANSVVHSYTAAGTFHVNLIASNGCKDTAAKAVIVYPKPSPSFNISNDQQCLAGNSFQFTNTSTINSGTMTYSWSFGDGTSATSSNASHVYAGSGIRSVKLVATSNNFCKDSTSHTVVVFDQLSSPVVSVDSASIGANSVTFTWLPVPGATGYQVSVNNGPFITPSSGMNGLSHTATNLAPVQHVVFRVRAIGVSACRTSEPATILVTTKPEAIFIPNTFTPNGDGNNDYFAVYGNAIKSVKVAVFNQWGQKLSESTDPSKAWDGTFNGKLQPSGVYVYVATVTLNNKRVIVKHGSLNLVR